MSTIKYSDLLKDSKKDYACVLEFDVCKIPDDYFLDPVFDKIQTMTFYG